MASSLKRRYVAKLLANITGALIGMVLIAIVPKYLGPVPYGQFVFLQDFFSKIMAFLEMGSSMAFFTKISASNDRKELLSFYFLVSIFMLILVFLLLFSINITGFTQQILPGISIEYAYLGLLFGFFVWLTKIFISISDAYALTVSVELVKIGHKIISLLFLLSLIYYSTINLEIYFYFQYISLVSFLIVLSWILIKKNVFTRNAFSLNFEFTIILKEFFEYCSPLFIYSLIVVTSGLFDIWLLQSVAGSAQTGFYGLSYGLAAVCLLFTSALVPIITREFSASFNRKDITEIRRLYLRYVPMIYSVSAYFSLFILVQSDNIIDLFVGEEFAAAKHSLMIMALYPILQTFGQMTSSVLYATGQTKKIRNIAIYTAPLGVFLSYLFIYMEDLGSIGLSLKMVIVAIVTVNMQFYMNTKYLNFKAKKLILHQLYTIVFFLTLSIISRYIVNIDTAINSFLVSGLLYTFLVAIFTYIFPQIFSISRGEIKSIWNKIGVKFEH
jgi:O-antigen/teichoic acid export membrane protein